jgi:N-terminal domain of oxidoreductase
MKTAARNEAGSGGYCGGGCAFQFQCSSSCIALKGPPMSCRIMPDMRCRSALAHVFQLARLLSAVHSGGTRRYRLLRPCSETSEVGDDALATTPTPDLDMRAAAPPSRDESDTSGETDRSGGRAMSTLLSRAIRRKTRPTALPTPDDVELATVALDGLIEGEVQAHNRWTPVGPHMRGRMTFALRKPLDDRAAGAVIASRHAHLILAALTAAALASCAEQPQPWSPEVQALYQQMYGPLRAGAEQGDFESGQAMRAWREKESAAAQ